MDVSFSMVEGGKERRSHQEVLAALKACSRARNLGKGKQVHAEAVQCGHVSNPYVATALINMYAKCGSMVDARQVFDDMKHTTVVPLTALILGYAENEQGHTALELFTRMRTEGLVPDSVALLAALKACTALAVKGGATRWAECRDRGRAIHIVASRNADIFMQSTLVDMYTKCGSMLDARDVFDCMNNPDIVSWNVLILGYADNGQGHTALDLFTRMNTEGPTADSVTFVAALKACASLALKGASCWKECRERGKEIHNVAVENDCSSAVYVKNTLVDMYAKCGSMVNALQVFDSLKHPTVVSWTALIGGYTDNEQGHTALDLFCKMRVEGPPPDSVIFGAALKACGMVGALEFGRRIHSEIKSFDVVLVNCLVDFYAKCGSLIEAQSVFDLHAQRRDVITWNALLSGFSSCGDKEAVFGLFEEMQSTVKPNDVTFLCILKCCSHVGLVEKGKNYFDSMFTKYGIVHTIDHYNCMADNFGRANKFDDAMALLEHMPCSPNAATWMTILGACRKWKNVDIGRLAFQSLIDLNSSDVAAYALMGEIYGSRGMLQEQEFMMEFRKKLETRGTKSEFRCDTRSRC